jgi:hypothetical protein
MLLGTANYESDYLRMHHEYGDSRYCVRALSSYDAAIHIYHDLCNHPKESGVIIDELYSPLIMPNVYCQLLPPPIDKPSVFH